MRIEAAGQNELKALANEFVNTVFWGTMLKEFRASQRATLLGTGPGNKVFEEELDHAMIQRMSQGESSSLADSLLRQLGGGRSAASVKAAGGVYE